MNSAFIAVVSGMKFEADILENAGARTIYGLDTLKLAHDMERAAAEGASGFLSFGTAAGLSPALSPGSILIAHAICDHGQLFSTDAEWGAALAGIFPEAVRATLAGVDEPLKSAQEKSSLHALSGAFAADMESHLVARVAQQYHVPFAVLRVVLDDAGRALPPAALAATRADGSIDYRGLMASLLHHPLQLPALLQLAADQRKARQALLHCGNGLKVHGWLGLVNKL